MEARLLVEALDRRDTLWIPNPNRVRCIWEQNQAGIPVENPEETKVVQWIFELYAEGKTISSICNELVLARITPGRVTSFGLKTMVSGIIKRADLYIKRAKCSR